MTRSKGFTLIDLLIGISVIGILTGYAIPSFSQMLHEMSLRTTTHRILHSIAFARESAIVNSIPMSICPTDDGTKCSSKWEQRYLIYQDDDGNGVQNGSETKILSVVDVGDEWEIKWAAFGHKTQITFTPQGFTANQNGSFKICSTRNLDLGRVVIVNKPGRGRIGSDKDGDGYSEKPNGQNMTC